MLVGVLDYFGWFKGEIRWHCDVQCKYMVGIRWIILQGEKWIGAGDDSSDFVYSPAQRFSLPIAILNGLVVYANSPSISAFDTHYRFLSAPVYRFAPNSLSLHWTPEQTTSSISSRPCHEPAYLEQSSLDRCHLSTDSITAERKNNWNNQWW